MRHSYAQNFEDVLLNRCFADDADGFYVDVGAAAPVTHSVSLNFYLRGWRGLNVEPIPERAQDLRWARPRDIVVEAAVSDHVGRAVLQRTAGAGGRSSLSSAFLAGHPADVVWPVEVRATTLRDLLAEHDVGEISFLKIDVEGAEDKVLAGMDFSRWRPVVLVVEAVTPTRPPQPNFAGWEQGVLDAGYAFAYFDGLNRYYLRAESSPLMRHFQHPACAFDALSRFEDFGDPLLNRAHPQHEFAIRTAKLLFRALASGGALDPATAFLRDYAPAFLSEPVSPAIAEWAIRHWLAREPAPGEAARAIAGRSLSVRQWLAEIFASDEFRIACASVAS